MDNNKDNKKKFVVIIGTLAILLLLVGATYAYFALNVNQGNTKTNINASTTPVDNISLQKSASDLHITLRPDDMALTTISDYYAVTEEDKDYEKRENMVSLAELTASGGVNNAAYNCEVKITISKNTDDTMTSVLKDKDAEVRLSFGDLLEDVDLVGLQTAENIVKTGHITLINNSNDFINAYLKVSNTEADQEYLADQTLDININTEVIKCDVIGTSKTELALRNTNTSNTLSKELKGGMFRYQGTADDVTDNYICFGTDNKDDCLNNQNQYMYRIIGVTPEGRVKVIKKEALDEEISWADNYDDVEFPESNSFKAINGEKFLENPSYIPNEWKDKIYNSIWTYGNFDPSEVSKIGEELYQMETGKKGTTWNEKASSSDKDVQSTTVGFHGSPYFNQILYYKTYINEKWTKKFISKVSLMYLHDYYYSVSDTANCQSDNTYEICQTGWMHLSQNDKGAPCTSEATMARRGLNTYPGWFDVFNVGEPGGIYTPVATEKLSIRPVFFLNNNIEISGKGTMTEPYMIK